MFCIAAFAIAGGKVLHYALPNCNPKTFGEPLCFLAGDPFAHKATVACYNPETKKAIYYGPAYPTKET